MIKKEFVEIYRNLHQLGSLKGVRFSYFVNKNINIMKPEVEALDKALEADEGFNKFETERVELAKKHAKKDKKGKPVIEDNGFVLEDTKEFDKEFTTLKETHKESYAKREKQIEDYNNMLREEIKFEFHKIKIEDMPEDISTAQMNGIYDLIQE